MKLFCKTTHFCCCLLLRRRRIRRLLLFRNLFRNIGHFFGKISLSFFLEILLCFLTRLFDIMVFFIIATKALTRRGLPRSCFSSKLLISSNIIILLVLVIATDVGNEIFIFIQSHLLCWITNSNAICN